jgi:hypothetical protein
MKTTLMALLAGLALVPAIAHANVVDLRGKKGVVDPRDLKKYDPPPRSLHIKEPPAPVRKRPSSDQPKSPPNGTVQGPNHSAPVRRQPVHVAPARPARPARPVR